MNRTRAFTLIEVIIVTAIVAVLAVSAISYYGDAIEGGEIAATKQNLQVIRESIGRYFKDRLQYPTDLEDLNGPYFDGSPYGSLVRSMGNASWALYVEVPDIETYPGVSPNAFVASEFRDIYYDPSGPKTRQFRKIKIKVDDVIMGW